MNELRAISDAAEDASRRGTPAVLATVVRVAGSAYRRPGARLLLCPDSPTVGLISGGCLEGDVAKKAWWRTESGPAVVRYDTGGATDDGWAFGLGCSGVVDVLLERLRPGSPPGFLPFLRDGCRLRRVGVLARVIGGAGPPVGSWLACDETGPTAHDLPDPKLATAIGFQAAEILRRGRSASAAVGPADVFFEVIRPAPSVVVCGAGPDAVPVVDLAHRLGWHVTVCAPRGTVPPRNRFPLADEVVARPPEEITGLPALCAAGAAIVMSHNWDDDRRFLRAALESPVGYVGVLGPRRRTEALLRELADGGYAPAPARVTNLYAPVGLDLGSETPAEVALAVIAEVQAALTGRAGGALRDRAGPIHPREPLQMIGPAS